MRFREIDIAEIMNRHYRRPRKPNGQRVRGHERHLRTLTPQRKGNRTLTPQRKGKSCMSPHAPPGNDAICYPGVIGEQPRRWLITKIQHVVMRRIKGDKRANELESIVFSAGSLRPRRLAGVNSNRESLYHRSPRVARKAAGSNPMPITDRTSGQ